MSKYNYNCMTCNTSIQVMAIILKTSLKVYFNGIVKINPTFQINMDGGLGVGVIEATVSALADSIDEKVGNKWWYKLLYPFFIVGVLAIPIIYYFW